MKQTPLDAVRKLTAAWISKNAREMSRWLTDDILEIGPSCARALSGQKEFFARYRNYLLGPSEILSYRILNPNTAMLGARLALVHFRYRMRTCTEGVIEDSRGKESMLLQRRGRLWRVRYIHWHRER